MIEQNRDAQLMKLLTMETDIDKKKLRSVLDNKGSPLSAQTVIDGVQELVSQSMATVDGS